MDIEKSTCHNLFRLSDSERSSTEASEPELSANELQELYVAAANHGVLGIVLHRTGQSHLDGPGDKALIVRRWRAEMVKSVRLRQHGQRVMQALIDARVAGIVFKGMDFADYLYPISNLRPWHDIDLLVPRDQWDAAGEVLDALGFQQGPSLWSKYSNDNYGERSWHYRSNPDIVVELHWNLIRNPSLRRVASVGYDDLDRIQSNEANAWPQFTPASRVLIAAVHATYTHQFDRLLLLCDLQQACRRMERKCDIAALRAMADRTGTRAALDLALLGTAKLLEDEDIESLRRAVGPQRTTSVAARLISREMLLSESRWNAARRSLVREWLKRAA